MTQEKQSKLLPVSMSEYRRLTAMGRDVACPACAYGLSKCAEHRDEKQSEGEKAFPICGDPQAMEKVKTIANDAKNYISRTDLASQHPANTESAFDLERDQAALEYLRNEYGSAQPFECVEDALMTKRSEDEFRAFRAGYLKAYSKMKGEL